MAASPPASEKMAGAFGFTVIGCSLEPYGLVTRMETVPGFTLAGTTAFTWKGNEERTEAETPLMSTVVVPAEPPTTPDPRLLYWRSPANPSSRRTDPRWSPTRWENPR